MNYPAQTEQAVLEDEPGSVPWGLWDVAIAIGVVLLAILVALSAVVVPAWAVFGQDSTGGRIASAASTLVAEAVAAVVIYRIILKQKHAGLRELGFRLPLRDDGRRGFRLSWLALVVGGWFVAYLLLVLYVAIVSEAGVDSLEPPEEQIPSELFSSWAVIAVLGVSVLGGAPLFEELFFRGFVFPALARSAGSVLAAIGSGLLFSIAHFDLGFIIPYAGIGAWFAYLYRRTDSLYTSMLCHFLFNLAAFSLLVAHET